MEQRDLEYTTDQPLDEEERRLMDPQNWRTMPCQVTASWPKSSFRRSGFTPNRFTKDEFRPAERARREGRLTTELVRDVALAHVERKVPTESLPLSRPCRDREHRP